jgi:hypothetical protein
MGEKFAILSPMLRSGFQVSIVTLVFNAILPGQAVERTLPFVGCVSYGQTERVEAPKAVKISRPLSAHDAENLAYYKSDEIGLVAPKGWHCQGYSGSSGWGMFLSPEPIRGEPAWPNFKGPANDLYHISGETGSGSSQIAEAIARVFPGFRAWAVRSMADFDTKLLRGPYPADRLTYRSSRVVEFETPPGRKGFGNDFSRFITNDKPTYGVAILMGDPPSDLIVLTARMPAKLQFLLPVIREDIEKHRGE